MQRLVVSRGLVALGAAVSLLLGTPAWSDICNEVAKAGLAKALEKMGVSHVDLGMTTFDAWLEYLKTPDDGKKLDAAVKSLLEGGAELAFPAYGIAIKGGTVIVAGVDYTIDQAKEQQSEAFLCGNASFNEPFSVLSFFNLPAVQQRGLDCNNFGKKVTTIQELDALHELWKGYYTRQVLEIVGPQNKDAMTRLLNAGWATLERDWKLHWGAMMEAKLRAELRAELERQAKSAREKEKTCTALPDTSTTSTKSTNPGSNSAELVWNRTPDANSVIASKGTLSGDLSAWQFSGPATLNGKATGSNVTCRGQLTASKPGPGAGGKMTCDIAWGTPQTVWHCEGPGTQRVSWSVGDYWFGMWFNACEGNVTENGKTQPNKFGLVGLRSGFGLQ